jgi:two-component system OmpR family sensor kinase
MPARWYRSFYWRIALGFVAFLAAMLIVQGVLFVWVLARSGRTAAGESPERLAQAIAGDLAIAMAGDPALDVSKYVTDRYAREDQPFFVLLRNDSLVTTSDVPVPEPMLRAARMRLARRRERPFGPPFPGRGPEGRLGFGGPGSAGLPGAGMAPIIVGGQVEGIVSVLPQAPFGAVLRRFAPILAAVATGVLILGAVAVSLLVFGPARRRLRGLEEAARRLGSGDLTARAPEGGGDEIASVASAFNAMAGDLAARAAALAASDRVRRQLLADVSHELTTPVTAMRGYLETLTMPEMTLDAATKARYLSIIQDESTKLERIIGDLLDLARLEGGGGDWSSGPVDVAELFARVEARHGQRLDQAGVHLSRDIAPGAGTVIGDANRLEQALQNLAANALRYAPRGSTLHLAARPAENRARPGSRAVAITVEDEGPGISPEHVAHIFDRFYKVDAARTGSTAGSGLGLSIVKAIVERHGGHVTVTSAPGRTVFELVLPAP